MGSPPTTTTTTETDVLARKIFVITMVGVAVYSAAVILYVLL